LFLFRKQIMGQKVSIKLSKVADNYLSKCSCFGDERQITRYVDDNRSGNTPGNTPGNDSIDDNELNTTKYDVKIIYSKDNERKKHKHKRRKRKKRKKKKHKKIKYHMDNKIMDDLNIHLPELIDMDSKRNIDIENISINKDIVMAVPENISSSYDNTSINDSANNMDAFNTPLSDLSPVTLNTQPKQENGFIRYSRSLDATLSDDNGYIRYNSNAVSRRSSIKSNMSLGSDFIHSPINIPNPIASKYRQMSYTNGVTKGVTNDFRIFEPPRHLRAHSIDPNLISYTNKYSPRPANTKVSSRYHRASISYSKYGIIDPSASKSQLDVLLNISSDSDDEIPEIKEFKKKEDHLKVNTDNKHKHSQLIKAQNSWDDLTMDAEEQSMKNQLKVLVNMEISDHLSNTDASI